MLFGGVEMSEIYINAQHTYFFSINLEFNRFQEYPCICYFCMEEFREKRNIKAFEASQG